MNKLIAVLMLFVYTSACRETTKKKQAEVRTEVNSDTSKAGQNVSTPGNVKENENVIIEDPKVITDGEHTQFYKSGKVKAKGSYKDGKRDGHWTVFYESGVLWSEATYVKGKKSGDAVVYYASGKKRYEGQYDNDKRTGTWRYYDQNGVLLKTEEVK